MAARDSLAFWALGGLRASPETREPRARRASLGSPESQDPKETGEIPGTEVTKDLPVGRASRATLESLVTKASRA